MTLHYIAFEHLACKPPGYAFKASNACHPVRLEFLFEEVCSYFARMTVALFSGDAPSMMAWPPPVATYITSEFAESLSAESSYAITFHHQVYSMFKKDVSEQM